MVSQASTQFEDDDKGRDWRAATRTDFVRYGMYALFKDACRYDSVDLRKSLRLLVEAGHAIEEGANSKRKIQRKLEERLATLPRDMGLSGHTLTRSSERIRRVLGVEVFVCEPYGKRLCGFTNEGRILWEEATRWAEMGLLDSSEFVDFPSVLRLARSRNNGEQNASGNQDIQRG
jgi:hypothetical protein